MLLPLREAVLLNLIDAFFVCVHLVGQHLVSIFVHLEDEVKLRPFRIEGLAQLHRQDLLGLLRCHVSGSIAEDGLLG